MKQFFNNIGPGPMVAAAFIGPGTVTVSSLAGAQFGVALLWALLFSTIATIVLQEASARLGLVAKLGLASAIKQSISHPLLRLLAVLLVVSAVVVGAIAYESGNIRGGSIGLITLFEGHLTSFSAQQLSNLCIAIIGLLAFGLLWLGKYQVIERSLVSLVILMSIAFMTTAVMVVESWTDVFLGLFVPTLPAGSLLIVIALIGTTIVPYNLFLHSELVQQKWKSSQDLGLARRDAVLAVGFGGLISMSIVVCAAAVQSNDIRSAADLAQALQPLMGDKAVVFIALGLFAAGLTSAITAPIAATLVLKGVLSWSGDLRSTNQRLAWSTVLLLGVAIALLQINAVDLIKFAQVANGLVLPFAVAFLLFAMNQKTLLKNHVNSLAQNIAIIAVLLIVTALGFRAVVNAIGTYL